MIDNTTARIRRVRLKARGQDPLTLNFRISRVLATVEFRPSGLPSSAVLCVRSFKDPLPGTLRLAGGPESVSTEWRNAAAASMDRLFRAAARPAAAPPSTGAEAVLFLDRAELLACLARDWCDADGTPRWWWESLFPGLDLARALSAAWLETPAAIPAAIVSLADNARARHFLRALDRADVRQFLDCVLRAFALTGIASALETTRCGEDNSRTGQFNEDAIESIDGNQSAVSQSPEPPVPPWQAWIEPDPALPWEQQCLLGTCVVLQRSPAFVRSRNFAQALRLWHQACVNRSDPIPQVEPSPAVSLITPALAEKSITPSSSSPSRAQSSNTIPEARPGQDSQASVEHIRAAPDQPPELVNRPSLPQPSFVAPRAAIRMESTPVRATTEVFETEWGGIFYLINVAFSLELYGDFTMPARPGLALVLWDFLALLGQPLIGDAFETDPLPLQLAQLSGRAPHEPPGRWFEPPAEWRMPAGWLVPFTGSGSWILSREHGRLRLQHPEGFFVLDVAGGNELEKLSSDICPAGGFVIRSLPAPAHDPLERWLDWLVPYVQARLIRTLAVADRESLRELAFHRHARVEFTGERVEIGFSLKDHPLALRLGGLDRNPGWVPAGGRTVVFHYD